MLNLHFVRNDDERRAFATWLLNGKRPFLGVDTETTGLDPWNDELRMVQFGDANDGWALPFPEERKLIHQTLKLYAGDMVAHHSKFDAQFLANAGLPYAKVRHDTKIMLHLLDSSRSTGLKENANRFLGSDYDSAQKALREKMRKNRWTWATVPKDEPSYWMYAALDPVLTARLADHLYPDILQRYRSLYYLELDVWQEIARAERRGMLTDSAYCRAAYEQLLEEIDEVECKYDMNLGSNKQVADMLISAGRTLPKTEKGNWSVTSEVLEGIDDLFAQDVLKYRRNKKIAETYFRAFLDLSDDDGYIHPTINTIGPRTGRMSCEHPNLQNVPRGSFVRQAFVASPGNVLVLADYAQIEYRIFASMCNEPSMIGAFLEGKDMHAETARIILGREPTKEERNVAKTANFAMLYGAGTAKFAKTAGIPIREAIDFMEQYENRFPLVPKFMAATMNYVRANGMAVDTQYGRRCPVDNGALYAGVNYMIQGTAADVLKQAIRRVSDTAWSNYFVLPIHDELVFDIPEDKADRLMAALPDMMEVKSDFAVPLTVEVKKQHRWGVAENTQEVAIAA